MSVQIQGCVAMVTVAGAKARAFGGEGPGLDLWMLFGFLAVFFTGVFYLEARRTRAARLTLGILLVFTSAFGLHQGAWPLGFVQLGCAGLAFAWYRASRRPRQGVSKLRSVQSERAVSQYLGWSYSHN